MLDWVIVSRQSHFHIYYSFVGNKLMLVVNLSFQTNPGFNPGQSQDGPRISHHMTMRGHRGVLVAILSIAIIK
jgi:hypothetical protein